MTDFPADASAFLENGIDQGELRTRLQDFLLATKQGPGFAGIEDITISSGSVTPTRGTVRVEGEGAAADDLVTIVTTNLPEGALLLLSIKDEGHVITVKHGTGAGNTSLAGGLDFAMNKLEQALFLQRRGTLWYEYARFGREKEHVVGGSGEPAFTNSWTAGSPAPSFWSDDSGVTRLHGTTAKALVAVASSAIFTLPAGYRPLATIYFPVLAYVGTAYQIDYVSVSAAGVVTWLATSGAAPSTVTVAVTLESISFRAEA